MSRGRHVLTKADSAQRLALGSGLDLRHCGLPLVSQPCSGSARGDG